MSKIIFLFSTLILLGPSFLNGFPFVYYDTGFYLYHAIHLFAEPALLFRPLTYSAMLALLHSGILLIVLQCAWLNILILKSAQVLGLSRRFHLPVMLLATVFTSMAVTANFLLPDIFIAIQFLALFNFLYAHERYWRSFFAFTFVIAGMTHYSNLILSVIALVAFVSIKAKRKLAIVFLLPVLMVPLLHFAVWNKLSVTNAASFFLFSRFTALDISQSYLKEHCPDQNLKLCVVINDGFDPWDWSSRGTLAKVGTRLELERELNEVNLGILQEPSLVYRFIFKSSVNWAKQLISFSKPLENAVNDPITNQALKQLSQRDYEIFSRQVSKNYDSVIQESFLQLLSHLYLIFVLVALCIFVLILKKISKIQIRFFILLFIALILNSLICGVLTEPSDRYQGRLIFLFPLFVFYILGDQLTPVLKKASTGRDVSPQTTP